MAYICENIQDFSRINDGEIVSVAGSPISNLIAVVSLENVSHSTCSDDSPVLAPRVFTVSIWDYQFGLECIGKGSMKLAGTSNAFSGANVIWRGDNSRIAIQIDEELILVDLIVAEIQPENGSGDHRQISNLRLKKHSRLFFKGLTHTMVQDHGRYLLLLCIRDSSMDEAAVKLTWEGQVVRSKSISSVDKVLSTSFDECDDQPGVLPLDREAHPFDFHGRGYSHDKHVICAHWSNVYRIVTIVHSNGSLTIRRQAAIGFLSTKEIFPSLSTESKLLGKISSIQVLEDSRGVMIVALSIRRGDGNDLATFKVSVNGTGCIFQRLDTISTNDSISLMTMVLSPPLLLTCSSTTVTGRNWLNLSAVYFQHSFRNSFVEVDVVKTLNVGIGRIIMSDHRHMLSVEYKHMMSRSAGELFVDRNGDDWSICQLNNSLVSPQFFSRPFKSSRGRIDDEVMISDIPQSLFARRFLLPRRLTTDFMHLTKLCGWMNCSIIAADSDAAGNSSSALQRGKSYIATVLSTQDSDIDITDGDLPVMLLWMFNKHTRRWRATTMTVDASSEAEIIEPADGVGEITRYPAKQVAFVKGLLRRVVAMTWFGTHTLIILSVRRSRFCLEILSRECSSKSLAEGKPRPSIHKIVPLEVGSLPHLLSSSMTSTSAIVLVGGGQALTAFEVTSIVNNQRIVSDYDVKKLWDVPDVSSFQLALPLQKLCPLIVADERKVLALTLDLVGSVSLLSSTSSSSNISAVGVNYVDILIENDLLLNGPVVVMISPSSCDVFIPRLMTSFSLFSLPWTFLSFNTHSQTLLYLNLAEAGKTVEVSLVYHLFVNVIRRIAGSTRPHATNSEASFVRSMVDYLGCLLRVIPDFVLLRGRFVEELTHYIRSLVLLIIPRRSESVASFNQYRVIMILLYNFSQPLFCEVLSHVIRQLEISYVHKLFPIHVGLEGIISTASEPQCPVTPIILFELCLSLRNPLIEPASRLLTFACESIGGTESSGSTSKCLVFALEVLGLLSEEMSLKIASQCLDFCCRLEDNLLRGRSDAVFDRFEDMSFDDDLINPTDGEAPQGVAMSRVDPLTACSPHILGGNGFVSSLAMVSPALTYVVGGGAMWIFRATVGAVASAVGISNGQQPLASPSVSTSSARYQFGMYSTAYEYMATHAIVSKSLTLALVASLCDEFIKTSQLSRCGVYMAAVLTSDHLVALLRNRLLEYYQTPFPPEVESPDERRNNLSGDLTGAQLRGHCCRESESEMLLFSLPEGLEQRLENGKPDVITGLAAAFLIIGRPVMARTVMSKPRKLITSDVNNNVDLIHLVLNK